MGTTNRKIYKSQNLRIFMTNNLTQILDNFRGNRDRAAEEGRFGDELPKLYAEGVKTRIYNDLGTQNYSFNLNQTNELNSYIGIHNGECYLVTPIRTEISGQNSKLNTLYDQLGDFLINVIEKGKMHLGNSARVQGTGALKKTGTCLAVDNSVSMIEKDDSLHAEMIEKEDSRFGNKYLVLKVNAPAYNALEVRDFLYKKLNQLQAPTLKEKVEHKVNKINAEELDIFLSD